jgi:hypothetical protein
VSQHLSMLDVTTTAIDECGNPHHRPRATLQEPFPKSDLAWSQRAESDSTPKHERRAEQPTGELCEAKVDVSSGRTAPTAARRRAEWHRDASAVYEASLAWDATAIIAWSARNGLLDASPAELVERRKRARLI